MDTKILSFTKPASCWEECFLLGNGSIGLSLWGGTKSEKISLNHDTFWAGYDHKENPRISRKELQYVRTLIAEKHYEEAERILENLAPGKFTYPYQPMGTLTVTYDTKVEPSPYKRYLDISTGTYHHESNGVTTEGFVSYPDACGVFRFSAPLNETIDSTIMYESPYPEGSVQTMAKDTVMLYQIKAPYMFDGFFEKDRPLFSSELGINGVIAVSVTSVGGSITLTDGHIKIEAAQSFCLTIYTGTDWNAHDPQQEAMQVLSKVSAKPYSSLIQRHTDDFFSLYSRNSLSLTKDKGSIINLPECLESQQENIEPTMIEAIYNYGKYLLLSSSREGCQPANLQGIWNTEIAPPWWSNYTMNINLEMNYWGAGKTGLSQCALPLFEYGMRLREHGKDSAAELYSAKGWCAHHQSDIWAHTNPRGKNANGFVKNNAEYSLWPFSGVWISIMAWEQFRLTNDLGFLENRVVPLLEGSIRFLKDFLIPTENGLLTTSPSTSPENRFMWNGKRLAVSSGSTMDLSLTKEAILSYLEMSEFTPCDKELLAWAEYAKEHIEPFRIGKRGQLQEWSDDVDLAFEEHRHLSHLYSVYPGSLLMDASSKEFLEAARKSFQMRSVEATGWSTVWKIALSARLELPEQILPLLKKFLTQVDPKDKSVHFTGSGCYPNLLCAHPPFQIDGNLGITGALLELFIQQIGNTIKFLPSLPENWPEGMITGYHVPGGTIIDFNWSENMVRSIHMVSTFPTTWNISCNGREAKISLNEGEIVTLDNQLNRVKICQ